MTSSLGLERQRSGRVQRSDRDCGFPSTTPTQPSKRDRQTHTHIHLPKPTETCLCSTHRTQGKNKVDADISIVCASRASDRAKERETEGPAFNPPLFLASCVPSARIIFPTTIGHQQQQQRHTRTYIHQSVDGPIDWIIARSTNRDILVERKSTSQETERQ